MSKKQYAILFLMLLTACGSVGFMDSAAAELEGLQPARTPALPQAVAGADRTVLDGVFTAAQADRGEQAYMANCSACHMQDLSGRNEAPALKGELFVERWREYDLNFLFALIKTQMPPERLRTEDTPPMLSDGAYVDIVAFLLRGNSFRTGTEELTLDALSGTHFVSSSGHEPVPSGALVSVVGCLSRVSETSWVLVQATEPVRGRPDATTAQELQNAMALPLGNHRFTVINIEHIAPGFRLDPYAGQRIHMKGYLIRQPEFERINLTALDPLAPSCP